MLELRSYQGEALIALFEYGGSGGGNALIDLPTERGKSLVISDLARRMVLRSRRRQNGYWRVVALRRQRPVSAA
jgi:superfamily II DNA or RNA helicase